MRRHRIPAAAALLLAGSALVTACSVGGGGQASGSAPTAPIAPTAAAGAAAPQQPAATPSHRPAPTGAAAGTVTIALAGDVHFAAQVAGSLADPATALARLRPELAGADLAMVNLETAITDRGTPAPKEFHFRAPPSALTALADAGVDVVTMANNHAVDYGPVGLADTLAAIRSSPIPVVGIGADAAQAYAPAYLTVRGTRIAVLGATQVFDWTLANWSASATRPGVAAAGSPARLVAAVRRARARADLVLVYLHWGTDYTSCPNALQRSTAAALAAAGAGIVVGSHAHRLQGAGRLDGTFVDYGLGNFVWWRRNTVADATTGVLTLTVTRGRVTGASWQPMLVGADGIPAEVPAGQRAGQQAAWRSLRACTGLSVP